MVNYHACVASNLCNSLSITQFHFICGGLAKYKDENSSAMVRKTSELHYRDSLCLSLDWILKAFLRPIDSASRFSPAIGGYCFLSIRFPCLSFFPPMGVLVACTSPLSIEGI